jgi:hypothetical protein
MGFIALLALLKSKLLVTLLQLLLRLKTLGFLGRVFYVCGLSLWTLLCLPTTPIELASGFVFPLWASTAMSVTGKTCGSILALLLGRRLLRPFVSRLVDRICGGGGAATGGTESAVVHRHIVAELRERPITTMSILRAAPLPTPLKIYGLCLVPPELVPLRTYGGVALVINSVWSLLWCLTGSSASSLQDAVNGAGGSRAQLVAQLAVVLALTGVLAMFGRFARERWREAARITSGGVAEAARSPVRSPGAPSTDSRSPPKIPIPSSSRRSRSRSRTLLTMKNGGSSSRGARAAALHKGLPMEKHEGLIRRGADGGPRVPAR